MVASYRNEFYISLKASDHSYIVSMKLYYYFKIYRNVHSGSYFQYLPLLHLPSPSSPLSF